MNRVDGRTEQATFAAGCFWGVEAAFAAVEGVVTTEAGYTGGDDVAWADPSYQQVCTGATGHAEAVRVEFDPAIVSYARLLEVFFGCHDPTQLNRQGPDIGDQYRSAIFFHHEAQRVAAQAARTRVQAQSPGGRPVVTEIIEATRFHPAEAYHQQYLAKRGPVACHGP